MTDPRPFDILTAVSATSLRADEDNFHGNTQTILMETHRPFSGKHTDHFHGYTQTYTNFGAYYEYISMTPCIYLTRLPNKIRTFLA